MITELLDKNPEKRPEMEEIMGSDWLRKSLSKSKLNSHSTKNLSEYLANMKKFKELHTSSIEEGFLVFMVNFIKNDKD